MANANELLIKINGDANSALKAFEDVNKKTDELTKGLTKASIVAGVIFAALSAEVLYAANRFSEGAQASNQLSAALQSQGIFTTELKENYVGIAEALSKKNGIEKDQIINAEAITQGFLGQIPVTKELTQLIIDYAARYKTDVPEAAALVSRAIGTTSNALARHGVDLKNAYTEAERMKAVYEQLGPRVNGAAEAVKDAALGFGGLSRAVDELQKAFGERFAPAIREVNKDLTKVVEYITALPPFVLNLAAAFTAGAAAASAFVALVGPIVFGITAIQTALVALDVELAVANAYLFGIPVLIGVLVTAVVLFAQNWTESMIQVRAVTAGIGAFIKTELDGLNEVISGLLHFNPAEIAEGWARAKQATKNGYLAYKEAVKEGEDEVTETKRRAKETQNADAKSQADKAAAERRKKETEGAAYRAANAQLKLLQIRQADKEEIQLQQEKVALLKDLETEQNKAVIAAAHKRLSDIAQLQIEQQTEDVQRTQAWARNKNEVLLQLQAEGYDQLNALTDQELLKLREQQQTENQAETQEAIRRLNIKIAADNQYLADQKRFGVAYATINRLMHSTVYDETKTAMSNLAELANSSNSVLKAIGKQAAATNIAIKTAESAMSVFSWAVDLIPPPAGEIVGLALAAGVVAYGAEQIANVEGAANGAFVTGGTAGRDSVPFMLSPGELVAPERNFNEVVNGVKTERSGIIEKISAKLDSLTAQQGGVVNVTIQGDMLAEDSYVDRLAQALGRAVQFRNTPILGVTA